MRAWIDNNQREEYRLYHRDGLLDLTTGLGITGFGLVLLTGQAVLLGLVWAALFLYLPVKTWVAHPRLSNGFPSELPLEAMQNARRTAIGVLLAAILLESLLLFALEFYPPAWPWLEGRLWLVVSCLLALTLAAIGVGVGIGRLALYGGMAMILALLQDIFDLPVFLPYLVTGLACGLSGAVLLAGFLRRSPRLVPTASD